MLPVKCQSSLQTCISAKSKAQFLIALPSQHETANPMTVKLRRVKIQLLQMEAAEMKVNWAGKL